MLVKLMLHTIDLSFNIWLYNLAMDEMTELKTIGWNGLAVGHISTEQMQNWTW